VLVAPATLPGCLAQTCPPPGAESLCHSMPMLVESLRPMASQFTPSMDTSGCFGTEDQLPTLLPWLLGFLPNCGPHAAGNPISTGSLPAPHRTTATNVRTQGQSATACVHKTASDNDARCNRLASSVSAPGGRCSPCPPITITPCSSNALWIECHCASLIDSMCASRTLCRRTPNCGSFSTRMPPTPAPSGGELGASSAAASAVWPRSWRSRRRCPQLRAMGRDGRSFWPGRGRPGKLPSS
jgi:hypothetical protein